MIDLNKFYHLTTFYYTPHHVYFNLKKYIIHPLHLLKQITKPKLFNGGGGSLNPQNHPLPTLNNQYCTYYIMSTVMYRFRSLTVTLVIILI
jgi:hypothetical protein